MILLNTVCLYFRCFSAIESFNLRISICNVSLAISVDPDQTVIVGAVRSCSTLCVLMLKSHFLFVPYQLFKKKKTKKKTQSLIKLCPNVKRYQ